jgi:ABC-type multidrug transport system fused ATPase/permease subunit
MRKHWSISFWHSLGCLYPFLHSGSCFRWPNVQNDERGTKNRLDVRKRARTGRLKINSLYSKKLFQQIEGEIKLENVSFAYPRAADHLVLRGINLKAAKGKSLALVGPSGKFHSVKSLIKCAFRLWKDNYYGSSGALL